MTNLLFPTDFSSSSTAALDWVRLFARKTGATITLLHVYQPMIPDTTLPTVGDPGFGLVASQEIEEISRQRLLQLEAELQAEGFSVRAEWRIGSVDDEILDAAKGLFADLIVMGRSDLNTFFDRLAGSAVSDVADEAVCPVLIVPITTEGQAVRPAQVHTIVYAMQPKTTQSVVSAQTDSLIDTFDAKLSVLTDDQLDNAHADLIVMQLYPEAGFLDKLLHPNRTARLVEKSTVPVLVYHREK
ncbi:MULTISPECIES: universal stress protein [Spirosoma]|uniref:Universal stress protein n=1 Tax=Spirosoma liriopis TaxID=2937440 RepID=A0ABT0HE97_9BACT|nr:MULTISPECIES: universal stress protein [Spirosoma]MCK8490476.1 universal stress protein [Spirosoma liriopis]UHG89846.1 universal stress protein [Spirosoma oryzicola]